MAKGETQMKKLITICLLCVLSTASIVLADNIFPPSWRGLPGTLTAEWDSWEGSSFKMYPDDWTSNPKLSYTPNAYLWDGANFLSEFEGRDNVIELLGDRQIDFWLPNFDNQNPCKDVWIQVTYFATPSTQRSSIDVSVYPYSAEISEPVLINEYSHGDGWFTDVWNLQIYPNPLSEFIYVNFFDTITGGPSYAAYIDQVVIDTYCIPEPATICLLSFGALSLIRRRKK
jgi:hypothetical protein